MKDADRDAGQLITELEQLRQRIAELEASAAESKKAEDRYRLLLENAAEAIAVTQDGKIKFANPKLLELTGHTIEELGSILYTERVHPDDRDMVIEYRNGRLTGESAPQTYNLRIIDKAGNVRWLERNVTLIDWEGGPAALIFETDITERKRVDEALKQSESRYRELAESITDVFFALDSKLRYTYWNKASEELTGVPAKEALGKHMSDVFPDDEAARRAESAYRRALVTKEPQHFVNEHSIGGRDYVFEISAYPTQDGLCVYVKDITERRKLEKALIESEQWYRHLFDNAPFGIGFSSTDGKIITMNKAMGEINGYSVDEMSKINMVDIYVNKADREFLLQEMRRHGSVADYPLRLKRKGGSEYDAVISARLATIGDREIILTILHDVTERKRAEEALKESEKRFRAFFEDAPAYCYMVSTEGNILDVNKIALRVLGYTEDELIGKPLITTLYAPGSRQKAEELFRIWRETGKLETQELKIITKEGVERIVLLSAGAVRSADGEVLYSISMQRDITERKRAEEALRLSEQNFRDSIENSPLGIRIASEDGKTLYVNRSLLSIYGYGSLEELEAVPRKQLYTPESYAEHRERVEKRKRGELIPPNYEVSIVRRDGQMRDLSVSRGEVLWNGERQFQVVYQDITERKQAEEQYQTIIHGAMDGFWQADMQGHFLDVNEAYCSLTGYSREELLNMAISDIEAIERPEETAERMQKISDVGYERFESRHRRKDGAIIDVEVSVNYLPIHGGRVFTFIRDITERKKAEESLMESEERYRSLIELSPEAIFVATDGKHVFVNTAGLKLFGASKPDQIIGKPVLDVIHPDYREVVAERMRKSMETGTIAPAIEEEFLRLDGTPVAVEVRAAPLVYQGKPAMQAVVRNISDRKKAEEALRASEEQYRLLAENVRDVIWSTDMDLRFTYVSPSAKYIVDRTAEEVMSMSFEQLLKPSSQKVALGVFTEELARAKAAPPEPGRSRTVEVEIIRRDGSTLWSELKMSFIRNPDGRPVGILGVMRDITERKKAEEERKEMEQKAQLASRLASVGELAAGIAHEINNPLTGVIGYAELLMHEDVPEHIKNDLKIIYEGAKRVADVVKGLLTFARQTRPERTVVDVNQVIEIVLRLRAYELETGNITATARLAPDIPATVADAGQLQQVFLNLIINAEMEMRSAHGKGKLIIKTESVGNTIRISFKDNGPGIAEENLERIFDPFFTTKEVGEGAGLGLSICHGIVAKHGGRIWAESQSGNGATFVVELPVVTEAKRPRQAKTARKAEKTAKGKILVVDDEQVVRQLLIQVLTEEGHEVETTDNGKDALKRIKSNNYNLILLDLKLPEMSGNELYERIKEIEPSLAKRVVFITGDVMGVDTEAILARTGVPCITKPFDIKELGAEVNRLLTGSRRKDTHQVKSQKPKVRDKSGI